MNNTAETPSHGVGKLLFDNRFIVPNHQRDYSWTVENARELVDDVTNAMDSSDGAYFIGLMVFMRSSEGRLMVLDGQQRLATSLMLICAVRNWLNQYDDYKQDGSSIQMQFVGRSELGQRTILPRLSLNSANNDLFERLIIKSVALNEVKTAVTALKKHDRNRTMLEVFLYLSERVDTIASQMAANVAANYLIKVVQYVRDNVSVVSLDVQSEGTAYTIFESLNDRGMELSPLDLVKNHLFSRADSKHGTQLRDMEARWAQMMATLANVKRDAFLKAFWISRLGRIRTPQLFDSIKKASNRAEQAVELSFDMLAVAEHYAALENSKDVLWSKYDNNVRTIVENLKIIGSQQAHPIILAGIRKFSPPELLRLLRLIEVATVRYILVVGGNTGRFETTCAIIARSIHTGEISKSAEVLTALRDVYPTDDEFRNAFAVKQERSGPKIQYIFRSLEAEELRIELGKTSQEIALPDGLTIEHVFPKNPGPEWKTITDDDPGLAEESFADRLGNVCLLSDINRTLGRKGFTDKKPEYERSTLRTTSSIAQQDAWNRKAIEHRQAHLAKRAVTVWRFQ